MSVTASLLRLFRVDQQLRGLRSRLDGAQRFLDAQSQQLATLEAKRGSLDSQVRQLKAAAANQEGEANRLEERMNVLRSQMNSAKTNKEYGALLSELNTLKTEKSAAEDAAVGHLGKIEEIARELEQVAAQHAEREKIVLQAQADCTARRDEIKDRVAELSAQREALAREVPGEPLATLERLITTRGDEAMALVEVLDRRNHDYSCSSCMMTVPIESVNSLMAGRLTMCANCSCILFTDEAFEAPKGRSGTTKPSKSRQVAET